jgi:hypothetical protein
LRRFLPLFSLGTEEILHEEAARRSTGREGKNFLPKPPTGSVAKIPLWGDVGRLFGY